MWTDHDRAVSANAASETKGCRPLACRSWLTRVSSRRSSCAGVVLAPAGSAMEIATAVAAQISATQSANQRIEDGCKRFTID